jgi:hypothetical protein
MLYFNLALLVFPFIIAGFAFLNDKQMVPLHLKPFAAVVRWICRFFVTRAGCEPDREVDNNHNVPLGMQAFAMGIGALVINGQTFRYWAPAVIFPELIPLALILIFMQLGFLFYGALFIYFVVTFILEECGCKRSRWKIKSCEELIDLEEDLTWTSVELSGFRPQKIVSTLTAKYSRTISTHLDIFMLVITWTIFWFLHSWRIFRLLDPVVFNFDMGRNGSRCHRALHEKTKSDKFQVPSSYHSCLVFNNLFHRD